MSEEATGSGSGKPPNTSDEKPEVPLVIDVDDRSMLMMPVVKPHPVVKVQPVSAPGAGRQKDDQQPGKERPQPQAPWPVHGES